MTMQLYPILDREAIWKALFEWLHSQLGGKFQTMGRKHHLAPDLVTADQPALFQVATKEIHIPQKLPGMPPKIVLKGILIVYVFDDSPEEDIGQETVLPETAINNLLLSIDAAFVPDNAATGKFTLGGKVEHCWIEGDTDIDPGIFGPQAAAVIPVNILVL